MDSVHFVGRKRENEGGFIGGEMREGMRVGIRSCVICRFEFWNGEKPLFLQFSILT